MSTTTESTMVADTTLQLETDDQSTSWLAQVFQPFLMPIDADSGESQGDRYDWRFLGVSNLKSSKYDMSEVSFFQVFLDSMEKQSGSLLAETGARHSLASSPSTTSGVSTMTDETDVSKMAPQLYRRSETNGYHNHSAPIGHTIVMSLNTQVFKPSKRQLYYIFPCDAIVETVNETPPYELFCSFHSLDFFPEQKLDNKISSTASVATTNISPLNNQQGYTDIPSSPLLLTVASGIKAEQISIPSIVHLSLSGISQELYLIIKESVAGFETAYGRMIQLMKLHTEGVSNRHAELLVVNGNNGTRSKKPTIETKTGKTKRKGSYQQRQTSPRTAAATAITPTTSNLSNKAKPTISANDIDSNATSPKQPILSPPMPSHVATPSNSAPIIPSGTSTSPTNASHRHNSANGNGRKCHYCGSKSTPMWRRGPEGAGTLCNACGVKWKHGKILCGKQPGSSPSDAALGSTSSPTPTSTKSANGYISKSLATKEQKKRKQHVELKIKKDKRIKIKEQQQQQQRLRQQNSHSWHGNGTTLDSMMETDDEDDDEDDEDDDDDDQNDIGSSGFSDDDDFMGEYDEDDDERMNHNIVAARHLTIHESQQHHHHPYHNALSTGSTPPQPQSRSRSMTTSAANEYMTFQQQQQQQQYQQQQQLYQQNGWSMANGFHHNQQHQTYYYQQQREEQQHRPRRHTADISVLDQVPWGEFPLSMGVDAVEAATVLTLLKRS